MSGIELQIFIGGAILGLMLGVWLAYKMLQSEIRTMSWSKQEIIKMVADALGRGTNKSWSDIVDVDYFYGDDSIILETKRYSYVEKQLKLLENDFDLLLKYLRLVIKDETTERKVIKVPKEDGKV